MEATRWKSFYVKIDGEEIKVELPVDMQQPLLVKIDGEEFPVEYHTHPASSQWHIRSLKENLLIGFEHRSTQLVASCNGWEYELSVENETSHRIKSLIKPDAFATSTIVKAPMPGLLQRFMKGVGEVVHVGDPLAILEAMKMENELRSTANGVIRELLVEPGKSVEKGTAIAVIDMEAA